MNICFTLSECFLGFAVEEPITNDPLSDETAAIFFPFEEKIIFSATIFRMSDFPCATTVNLGSRIV